MGQRANFEVRQSRRPRAYRPLGIIGIVPLLLAATAGCDLAAGLADVGGSLANPDAALLDTPGRKLASGAYRNLLVDGSLQDGGHIVAIRSDRGTDEVAVIPYVEGSACYVSPATNVDRLSSRIDIELSGVLSVQREADAAGRGTVSFVDYDCDQVMPSLEGSVTPEVAFPSVDPRGLLSLSSTGELSLIDAKRARVDTIAQGVALARTSGDSLYTVESGELVMRDSNLKEYARVGNGVTEFVVTSGKSISVGFIDSVGLYSFNQKDGAQLLADDACGLTTWGMDTLAYYSPCIEQRLVGYTLGSKVGYGSDYVRILGPPNAIFIERALVTLSSSPTRATELLFLRNNGASDTGELMLGTLEADPEDDDGVATLVATSLSADLATIRGGSLYVDWTGQAGTLVELGRDEENRADGLVQVAEGVAQIIGASPYSSAGVVTGYADGVGDLRVFTRSGKTIDSTLLASNAPIQSHSVELETGRRAFVADSSDGSVGTLYLTDQAIVPDDSSVKARAIGEHALRETARFLDQPRGVAYLARDPGEEDLALRVWLIDSEITLTIHKNVSEYRTVPWPAPGILYAVPTGKDQGLWFSKAR